jgi:hypothetical protein
MQRNRPVSNLQNAVSFVQIHANTEHGSAPNEIIGFVKKVITIQNS